MDDSGSSGRAADLLGGGGGGESCFTNCTTPGPGTVVIHYPRAVTIAAAVFCVIFIIVGVVGNVITVMVLRYSLRMPGRLSTAATLFLLSLCVSDLLFCAINLPLTASRYINEAWLLGETACQLFPFFFYGNVATSLFSMVAIAFNSFGPMLLPLTGAWGRLGLNERTFSCTILAKDGSSPKKALFAVGILLPCTIIAACYLLIYIRATRQRITTGRSSMPTSYSVQSINRKSSGRQEDSRLTAMMLTVFLAFIVCFLPLMLVNVLDSDDTKVPALHVLASVLAWMSAVINPFIYAGSSRYYRAIYRQLLCGRRGTASVSAGEVVQDEDATAALHWGAAQARFSQGET